ncbi:MAG: hypothetical protein AAFQ36_02095 [Pseudomonadota bacterium]
MSNQEFVDGVQEITIQGGIVRVDYFTYSAEEKDASGKPAKVFAKRLLLSPEAFLQSFSAMERIVDQLVERGAIKRKDDKPNGRTAASPNF